MCVYVSVRMCVCVCVCGHDETLFYTDIYDDCHIFVLFDPLTIPIILLYVSITFVFPVSPYLALSVGILKF